MASLSIRTAALAALLLQPFSVSGVPVRAEPASTRPPEEMGSVWGVFVESTGQRFVAQVEGSRKEYVLAPGGRITRNNRTSKMSDLHSGDQMLIHLVRPEDGWVARIEASSRAAGMSPVAGPL